MKQESQVVFVLKKRNTDLPKGVLLKSRRAKRSKTHNRTNLLYAREKCCLLMMPSGWQTWLYNVCQSARELGKFHIVLGFTQKCKGCNVVQRRRTCDYSPSAVHIRLELQEPSKHLARGLTSCHIVNGQCWPKNFPRNPTSQKQKLHAACAAKRQR